MCLPNSRSKDHDFKEKEVLLHVKVIGYLTMYRCVKWSRVDMWSHGTVAPDENKPYVSGANGHIHFDSTACLKA